MEAKLEKAFYNFFSRDSQSYWESLISKSKSDQVAYLTYGFLFWRGIQQTKSDDLAQIQKICAVYENEIKDRAVTLGLKTDVTRKITYLLSLEIEELDGKERKAALKEIKRRFCEERGSPKLAPVSPFIDINSTSKEYIVESAGRVIMWNLLRMDAKDDLLTTSVCQEFCQTLTEELRIRNIEPEVKREICRIIDGHSEDCDVTESYEKILETLCEGGEEEDNEIISGITEVYESYSDVRLRDCKTKEERANFCARELIFWMKENNFLKVKPSNVPGSVFRKHVEARRLCEQNINIIKEKCLEEGISDLVEKRFGELASFNREDQIRVCNECCAKRGLKRCNRCRSVYYCSRKCQKESWPRHKMRCLESL